MNNRRNDELYHKSFKYIKKERTKNGKYRYYYLGDPIKGTHDSNNGASSVMYRKTKGNPNSQYGTYERSKKYTGGDSETVIVKKSNKLLSSSTKVVGLSLSNTGRRFVETRSIGKIEQTMNKGKKWLKNLFK